MKSSETQGKQKGKTIRSQILSGYFILTGILILLVLVAVACMALIEKGYSKAASCQKQQVEVQSVVSAHYKWLEQLSDSITTGAEFKGSLDPTTCALGKWLKSEDASALRNQSMEAYISDIIQPHDDIHLQAEQLIEQSKADRDAAYARYTSDFKPKVEIIGSGLTNVNQLLQELADTTSSGIKTLSFILNIVLLAAGLIAVILSVFVGRRTAELISRPIRAVSKWSEQLASGVDNLTFDGDSYKSVENAQEIESMIRSFQKMADGIRENVRVIQRIADGDLTAYVEIKSSGDSLGKNLYHLVQNNDMMFANLLSVADSVANNAGQIAEASQSLAESATTQATAVETLTTTVNSADTLASKNAESAQSVAKAITDMTNEVRLGQERMVTLLNAVDEIQKASQKINLVMKSINDLAFQTNILSLNAAVEAARAGESGKGFAVVADEVHQLAVKSAAAADQSRALIENTIEKASQGSEISRQAGETFSGIVETADNVSEMIEKINNASSDQQRLMAEIYGEIKRISSHVTDNVASSEETAAATEEMTASAELIRQAMYKFNLRKREEGKPYIPPEKAHDTEFIREAYENYQKVKDSGTSSRNLSGL